MSSLFEKALDKYDKDDDAPLTEKRPARPADKSDRPRRARDESEVVREPPVRDLPPLQDEDDAPDAQAPPPLTRPVEPEPVEVAASAPEPAATEPDDARRTTNYAEIDLDALTAAGMITPNAAESVISEQHRMVKRPLLLKAFPHGGKRNGNENVILVTSSVPGEGKTFVSVNLAMSIAMEVDRTVLLVDGDPAKGNIAKMCGITAERGLTDYLSSSEVQLPDVLVRTNIPNLVLLPSGKHVANVTELFSSEQMKRLTDELASRYPDRVIIIDSAPLLATSGTRVLAGLAGQVLFVVEAIRTTQNEVREALHMIENHPNIGLVLNKSRESTRSGTYQYGYYGAQG